MVGELTDTVIRTIQDAAKRLTGAERRKFEAQVARDYCQGSARKAETIFGWGRVTVQTGLDELQTGISRVNRYSARGRRKAVYPHIRKLQIDLDNGPELASNRTQFIKRIVPFADQTGLTIELVYYPPYHRKYHSVERCWGILEEHSSGAILDSVDTVWSWAQSMTWKGVSPIVRLLDKTYERGVRLSQRAFRSFADRRRRSALLPKWSAAILPVAAEPV